MAQRSRLGAGEHVRHSKLNLVDLAGSERLRKTLLADVPPEAMVTVKGGLRDVPRTMTDPALKKESMSINRSLAFLEQCVVALTSGEGSHVPFRQTKLTSILRDSLGGASLTLLLACVWCEARHLEETVSTLQLAKRMMRVKQHSAGAGPAPAGLTTDPVRLAHKQARIIRELRQELAMHAALAAGRGPAASGGGGSGTSPLRGASMRGPSYEEYTPKQQSALAREVEAYLHARGADEELDALELDSVRKMREALALMKERLISAERRATDVGDAARLGGGGSGGSSGGTGTGTGTDIGMHADAGASAESGGWGSGLVGSLTD